MTEGGAEPAWPGGLRALAAAHGDRVAVSGAGAPLSYRALAGRAHALAARMAALGIGAGEPVAWSIPNSPAAVWATYGISLAGAAETPLHHTLTAEEVAWFGGLARVRWVVAPAARAEFFRPLGMNVIALEEIAEDATYGAPPADGATRGRILSTSGTTGKPKAIVYTYERRRRAHELLKSALPFAPRPGERILLMTPFPHGASLLAWAWLDHGAEVVLLDGVGHAGVEAELARGVDAVFAPPTVINKLAELFPERRFEGVRCVFTGTQTLTEAGYRRAERLFGPVVRITYGKTECTNPITVLEPAETAAYYASESRPDGACLGKPAAGVELEIREGEIWLRARHMANGYIDAQGFHEFEDGWHATGDLGWLDDRGRLWLAGRAADVIKTGGYKVQPDEIESVLAGMPGCGQVVVTSLPSEYWGEVIVAVAEGAGPGWIEEGRRRVASLSKHKQPRGWIGIAALPRNAQGKVNRRDVRIVIDRQFRLVDGPHPRLETR